MKRILFFDIQEKEFWQYTFEGKGDNYAIKEQKKFPLSDTLSIPVDTVFSKREMAFVSLPVSSLNFRVIALPFSDKEQIREVLPFELDGIVLGGSEAVIFDAVTIGRTESAYQVLAVYIEKNLIRTILERLKVHGIDPACITSIELKHALKDFSLPKLVPPISLNNDERVALAGEEIKNPIVNLRRNEFSYTREVDQARKSLKVTAVLCALIVLVLSVNIVFRILSSRQEIELLKNEIRKSYLDIFPGEKNIMNERYQLKAHMKELKMREGVFVGIKPLDVLSELAQIERQGVKFHEMTIDREMLTFRGEASSFSGVQVLQERLKQFFDEVSISDSKASVQGTTLFTITARVREV
jgi:type II secretory pathway component PulL